MQSPRYTTPLEEPLDDTQPLDDASPDDASPDDASPDDASPADASPADAKHTQSAIKEDAFRETCIDIITPAIETDIRDMVKGRVLWRRMSTIFEVLGRVSGATGTILAFAGGSEITGETLSRALSFSAGCLGTLSIVATLFANFSRQQSMERRQAINTILESVGLRDIPDVARYLVIQGTAND